MFIQYHLWAPEPEIGKNRARKNNKEKASMSCENTK